MQKPTTSTPAGTIPASTYKTAADVATIALPNLLVVRNDFPANDACAVTKVLFQQKAALAAAVPAAAGLDQNTAADTSPIELTEGSRAALSQLGNH